MSVVRSPVERQWRSARVGGTDVPCSGAVDRHRWSRVRGDAPRLGASRWRRRAWARRPRGPRRGPPGRDLRHPRADVRGGHRDRPRVPLRSVYKLHLLVDTDMTFLLTSGAPVVAALGAVARGAVGRAGRAAPHNWGSRPPHRAPTCSSG